VGSAAVVTSAKAFRAYVPGVAYAQDVSPPICATFNGSPATRPFLQQLPIPPALAQANLNPAPQECANIQQGEAPRDCHQRWGDFPFVRQYELHARPALVRFHPDLRFTYVWGFNGVVPGPTILGKYGEPAIVRFFNDLNAKDPGPGKPEITVHLHNGHVPSESDGFAGDFFGAGVWKDNHYPNIYAGYDQFQLTGGDPKEAQYSYWYHDHRAMFSAANTYKGLAGMYLLFDNIDSGDENDTNSSALRLPSGYGVHDIPLVFSDKSFCPDGTLYMQANGVVPLGDKWCINAAIQPFFRVNKRKYRFRFLNTGPARTWTHKLTNDLAFTVVATDGNLLDQPAQVNTIQHSVSERYDVIIDFSSAQIGDNIYLLNIDDNGTPQSVGNPSPTPLPTGVTIEQVTLRFDVVGDEADNSQVPAQLTTYPDISQIPIAATKEWNFDRTGGQFTINGLPFDPARTDHQAQQGTAETWTLKNDMGVSWTHPVHIHFEEFRILERNGAAPTDPLEKGRKDVVRLEPGNEVKIFLQFRDFLGRYLIHCHNINHEDAFMMVRFDIVNS
jgi:FtsP/CotA-like multicopper oxidase with cupredoxin domain